MSRVDQSSLQRARCIKINDLHVDRDSGDGSVIAQHIINLPAPAAAASSSGNVWPRAASSTGSSGVELRQHVAGQGRRRAPAARGLRDHHRQPTAASVIQPHGSSRPSAQTLDYLKWTRFRTSAPVTIRSSR
jgi:hypothetical protein